MTKSRQPTRAGIRPMHYASARASELPAEVVGRAELLARFSPEFLARPELLHFHLLVLCEAGEGAHWVDFERIAMTPGTLVYIAPGQVQRYDLCGAFDARMLVVPAPMAFGPVRQRGSHSRGGVWRLSREQAAGFERTFDELMYEQEVFRNEVTSKDLIRALVGVARCRLRQLVEGEVMQPGSAPLLLAFEELVESAFRQQRRAAWFAERLACSSRTLARAVQAERGVSPKVLIDQRVVLEAKRLLAYREEKTAALAAELGFPEVTHFGRFFQRMAGETPAAFRARWGPLGDGVPRV